MLPTIPNDVSLQFVCITLLTTMISTALAASAYKCVDADGAIYFSDKQCGGGQTQTRIGIKPPPPASGEERANIEARQARQQRIHDVAAQDREDRRKQRAEVLAQKKAAQQKLCDAEKSLLKKLTTQTCSREDGCTFYALKKKDEDGNMVYASEQAKKVEVNRLKKSIAEKCQKF